LLSFFSRFIVPSVVLLPPTHLHTHTYQDTPKLALYTYLYYPYMVFARGSWFFIYLFRASSSGGAVIWSHHTHILLNKYIPISSYIRFKRLTPVVVGCFDKTTFIWILMNYILYTYCILTDILYSIVRDKLKVRGVSLLKVR
jgi:hypothetical protein